MSESSRRRLILEQSVEILNVSTVEWHFTPWMSSTLLHIKVVKWAKAVVHVCSDAVLCLGKDTRASRSERNM